jgi:hypothetical protein
MPPIPRPVNLPTVGVPSRMPKGYGIGAEEMKLELQRRENQDIITYSPRARQAHPYGMSLIGQIGRYDFYKVSAIVRKLTKDPTLHLKCPRIYQRSEALMVKWLYVHQSQVYEKPRAFRMDNDEPAPPPIPCPIPPRSSPLPVDVWENWDQGQHSDGHWESDSDGFE